MAGSVVQARSQSPQRLAPHVPVAEARTRHPVSEHATFWDEKPWRCMRQLSIIREALKRWPSESTDSSQF